MRAVPLLLGVAVAVDACATTPAPVRPALVYASDFGLSDGAVAEMKGVALAVDPTLRIFDVTHDVPPFDVWTGAHRLAMAAPYFPAGTVFVVVVDPGVGTDRGDVVVRTKSGHVFVGPDNGLFTLVVDQLGLAAARDVDVARHMRPGAVSSTFFGRDLYSYVGARLAAGALAFDDVGPPARALVRLRLPGFAVDPATRTARGVVPLLDVRYGNVWTNIPVARYAPPPGARLHVVVTQGDVVKWDAIVPYTATFGDVPAGAPLAYENSLGALAFALNQGDLARAHGITAGPDTVVVVRTCAPAATEETNTCP